MAQDTKTVERPDTADSGEQPGFHYYSGGEVKELSNTAVSPMLWAFWSVVIVAALIYLFAGGALGPNSPFGSGFKPTIGSQDKLAGIQQDLNKQAYGGGGNAAEADMMRLVPIIHQYAPSQTLTASIENGSQLYQTYCIGCHGPNQDGNGVNASSLNPKPRNLHDGPFMRETLDYNRINHSLHYGVHGTAMPRWENTLSEKEIQEVISYVLSLTWDMPRPGMDTTTDQLQTPPNMQPTGPAASGSDTVPGKSPGNSVMAAPGGSFVRGGSVSNSPAPQTPAINGDPTAHTQTAPPSQSGSALPPPSVDTNAPDTGNASPGITGTSPTPPPAPGNGM